jgi:uncharacterized membrane protein (GlpM family)
MAVIVLKILLSAGMVVAITLTAERVSARLAGVMAGFPLGAGLTLFFLGLEQGPVFAAESALWSIQGILAVLGFCWCYRMMAVKLSSASRMVSLPCSCFTGLAGYFVTAAIIKVLPANTLLRTCGVLLLLLPPAIAFRKSAPEKIREKTAVTCPMLMVRAVFASLVILTVTGLAASVGPAWSGLLAAFPTVILPSVMILHFNYGGGSVPSFFRDTPLALPAIIVFSLAVHWSFPHLGLTCGTILSYGAALLYLAAYELKLRAIFDRLLPS